MTPHLVRAQLDALVRSGNLWNRMVSPAQARARAAAVLVLFADEDTPAGPTGRVGAASSAGAALLELLKSLKATEATTEVSWGLTIYGCVLASVVGYFSLKLLVKSLKGRWFWLFGPYCLLAGALTLALA